MEKIKKAVKSDPNSYTVYDESGEEIEEPDEFFDSNINPEEWRAVSGAAKIIKNIKKKSKLLGEKIEKKFINWLKWTFTNERKPLIINDKETNFQSFLRKITPEHVHTKIGVQLLALISIITSIIVLSQLRKRYHIIPKQPTKKKQRKIIKIRNF